MQKGNTARWASTGKDFHLLFSAVEQITSRESPQPSLCSG